MKLNLRSMFFTILACMPLSGATAFAQGTIDPSLAMYGTGSDFGVNLTNAFATGTAGAACQVNQSQRTCRIGINPTQTVHNIATTVTIPGGILLDCNGSWLNWNGPANGGPMFIFTNPTAEGTTIQNCNFEALGASPYTSNTVLWGYFGGDPAGVITPSTAEAFDLRFLNNQWSGFHAVIQGGNNWHNMTIQGGIARHNDYFIYDTTCGSNSGEAMQVNDVQVYNGNLNFAVLNCYGHEWKTVGMRWDYPNGNGVTGAAGAAGIIGTGINLQETNAHHEQSAAPMIYSQGDMLFTGVGGSYAAEGTNTYSGPVIGFDALHYGTTIASVGQQFAPGSHATITTFVDQTTSTGNPDACVTVMNARDTASSPVWLGGSCNMAVQNTPRPTCSASIEGTSWYTFGSSSANGALQVCQDQSGTYSWVTH